MLRRLGMLRGIEDVEYVAEGVRAAGVARLFLGCDDIASLYSSTQSPYVCEVGWQTCPEVARFLNTTLARIGGAFIPRYLGGRQSVLHCNIHVAPSFLDAGST